MRRVGGGKRNAKWLASSLTKVGLSQNKKKREEERKKKTRGVGG